jgi:hypothetical protein
MQDAKDADRVMLSGDVELDRSGVSFKEGRICFC